VPRSCSIARALEVVGERWALLVVREVALGVRRFEDIRLATGAPRAVLSARLRDLVAAEVLHTTPYREPGSRVRLEYRLTEAGRALQPVLTALMDWGDRHVHRSDRYGGGCPSMVVRHVDCGAVVHAELVCKHGHQVRSARELVADPGA